MNKSRRAFTLIGLAITATLLCGCGGNPATQRVQPCGSPTPAPLATSSSRSSNSELLKQAFANNRELKQYHLEFSSDYHQQPMSISADVDSANKKSMLYMSQDKQGLFLITVYSSTYISPDNVIYHHDTNPDDAQGVLQYVNSILASFDTQYIDSIAPALNSGSANSDQLGGVAVEHITENPDYLPLRNGNLPGVEEFWVTNDATPTLTQLKMTVNSKQEGNYNILATWSNLDQCFDLQPPY